MVETPDKPFERFIRGVWNLRLLWSIPYPYMAASMPHDAAGKATARFYACCGPDCHNVESGRSRTMLQCIAPHTAGTIPIPALIEPMMSASLARTRIPLRHSPPTFLLRSHVRAVRDQGRRSERMPYSGTRRWQSYDASDVAKAGHVKLKAEAMYSTIAKLVGKNRSL